MTEIESYRNSTSDLKIPLFDKKSSDFCFEKSRELLSKPFSIDLNTSASSQTLDKKYFDKKTRDYIGENLLDIEKTLNALNLDFLQAFNELEKTDSAETLFGENFLLENNLKTSPMTKIGNNFNNGYTMEKKSSKDFYSPIEKRSSTPEKSYSSPKDSQRTTPNSFSPQESTVTSRGFFFNYPGTSGVGLGINRNLFLSPTKRMGFSNSAIQKSLQQTNQSFQAQMRNEPFPTDYTSTVGPRQRSMSFTDNFEVKSPITSKAQSFKNQLQQKSMDLPSTIQSVLNPVSSKKPPDEDLSFILPTQSQLIANKPRNIITYKPKSIRARNLRRLSYNPINMIDSSSSSSESDMDRSIAMSECDIRSKMYHSRYYRKRYQQQYHRKLNNSASSGYYDQDGSNRTNSQFNSNNSSNMNINGREKLYGSNASIKSAPQYNYMSDRKKYLREELDAAGGGYDDKATLSSDDLDSDDDLDSSLTDRRQNPFKLPATETTPRSTVTPTPPSSNLNNIYEFVGKCFNRNRVNTDLQQQQLQTTQTYKFLKNKSNNNFNYGNIKGNKISSSNLDLLYTEFDVTKLTGKSPTTQSYFDIMNYSNNLNNKKQLMRKDSKNSSVGSVTSGTFQWPERIHGSTVKQNDLIWQLTQQHEKDLQEKQERKQQQIPTITTAPPPPQTPPQSSTNTPAPVPVVSKMLMENFKLKKTAYSSDTSSTETDSIDFRQDYIPSRMPPSPAP